MGQEREKRMWVGSGPLPCGAHSWPSPGAPVDPGSCSYFSTDSLSVVLTLHHTQTGWTGLSQLGMQGAPLFATVSRPWLLWTALMAICDSCNFPLKRPL